MAFRSSKTRTGVLLAVLAAGLCGSARAGDELSWREVELVAAGGVPNGPVHEYAFRGVLLVVESKTSKGFSLKKGGFYSQTSSRIKYAMWIEAVGEYDTRTRTAVEKIEIEGDLEGQVSSEFRVNEDPWLNHGALGVVTKANASFEGDRALPFDSLIRSMRHPLTIYAVDPGRAAELSRRSAGRGAPPPPPPPPPPKPAIKAVLAELKASQEPLQFKPIVDLFAGAIRIEGESLVGPAAKATAGTVGRQNMAPFGKTWSGGAQLFWAAPGPGAELRFPVRHPSGGAFHLSAYLTKAPDFGQVQFYVDGPGGRRPVGGTVDGYAPRVVRGPRIDVGTVQLGKGETTLAVRIVGKAPLSRGHYVGLDLLELTPATLTVARPGASETMVYRPVGDPVRPNPQPQPPSAWSGELSLEQLLDLYVMALRKIDGEAGVRLKVDVRPSRPLTPAEQLVLLKALQDLGLEPRAPR